MTPAAPALLARTVRDLSNDDPLITFPTADVEGLPEWYRFLAVRNVNAFEIGNVCGSCPFWFTRLPADAPPVDIEEMQVVLVRGLEGVDGPAVNAFGRLFESGHYRVALLSLLPERVEPGAANDYFVHEQVASWGGFDADDTLDPATPYYRIAGRSGVPLGRGSDLVYEFVAPLQPELRLDPERIACFERMLAAGGQPTAVAATVFDVKQSYDMDVAHACLTHYLLDGHHKMSAAARSGRPITLLSFISPKSLSWPDDIDLMLENYGRAEADLTRREPL